MRLESKPFMGRKPCGLLHECTKNIENKQNKQSEWMISMDFCNQTSIIVTELRNSRQLQNYGG
jgi:hypothetical protein